MSRHDISKRKKREPDSTAWGTVPTAVLIDGGFFLSRYKTIYPGGQGHAPEQVVENLIKIACTHAFRHHGAPYRIFFYDCRPFSKKAHNPITKKAVDFSKTKIAEHRNKIHLLLKKERKVALRFGELKDGNGWAIKPGVLHELFSGKRKFKDLAENDVFFDFSQKGVDMKIGVDVASLAYKKLVKRIILISGDSDFVPAAKLARREGIDFILDPLWGNIHDDLYEHIDGLYSVVPNPHKKKKKK